MKQKLSLIQIYYIIRLKYSFDSRYQKVNGVFGLQLYTMALEARGVLALGANVGQEDGNSSSQ